jgi:hypothetical protein
MKEGENAARGFPNAERASVDWEAFRYMWRFATLRRACGAGAALSGRTIVDGERVIDVSRRLKPAPDSRS